MFFLALISEYATDFAFSLKAPLWLAFIINALLIIVTGPLVCLNFFGTILKNEYKFLQKTQKTGTVVIYRPISITMYYI